MTSAVTAEGLERARAAPAAALTAAFGNNLNTGKGVNDGVTTQVPSLLEITKTKVLLRNSELVDRLEMSDRISDRMLAATAEDDSRFVNNKKVIAYCSR